MDIVFNMSTVGRVRTGVGSFSVQMHSMAEISFPDSGVICGKNFETSLRVIENSPDSIQIGSGRFAPLMRQVWGKCGKRNKNSILVSPTHHSINKYKNYIITVHDLIPIHHPEQYRLQNIFYKHWLPDIIKKAAGVITVSNSVKKEIVELYNISENKVCVVNNIVNGGKFFGRQSSLHEFNWNLFPDEKPFLLCVGAKFKHKNIRELLAMHREWSDDYRLLVVSAGGDELKNLKSDAFKYGIEDSVTFFGHISDEQLFWAYKNAAALIYPSLTEGFGIPPLEALSLGCPVVASAIPVHKEVLGEFAHFVDLGDNNSWRSAINAIRSGLIREKIIGVGNLLDKYSFEAVQPQFENAIKKLCY